ncbi:MAG: type I glyceraldehyde-3-phosphate dehydrogenase [Rickettsiales bacterium]|jgi:glyceraldehyde 3-phosphate dehydrogenase|nr:type I glyceraldehyde-3-phosphate dehydrogenase [Rickettsiales bacterium]
MVVKVAINGFGRIGRCVFRTFFENMKKYKNIDIVAINDLIPIGTNAHLLKHDSVHGPFIGNVETGNDSLIIDGKAVRVYAEKDATALPWKSLGIDVVCECTGIFTDREGSGAHLKAGAKKVIISAPTKDSTVKTIVMGVNDENLLESDDIVSNGSCTTNCLAPIVKILDREIGVAKGHMTTIHAFTNDQRTVDCAHKDLRRARAASLSMIPTTTGAAKAVALVLPQLRGKLDGVSIRVPTPDVSFVDFSFEAKRGTSIGEIHSLVKKCAAGELNGILACTEEELVSIDFVHNTHSSIFDMTQTKVIEDNFVRIGAWYDNEWGFSNRMLDTALAWFSKKV